MVRFHRILSSLICCASLGLVLARDVAAQQAAPDPASLLAPLGATLDIARLDPVARCAEFTGDPLRLCTGLVTERRAELSHARADALRAQDLLERAVVDAPRSAVAWYGLGLDRLQLARDTVFSKGGALMPVGVSYLDGAANALVRAIELDDTLTVAVNALALTPEPREGSSALKERVALLRRERRLLSPGAMAETAVLERDGGSVDSAIALERRALATGKVDSGVVSLGLARDLYRSGHADAGREVLLRGAATDSMASQQAYRAALAWVATPAELAAWDTVPPEHRSTWVAFFWSKRDVADGRPDGSRLVEHYRRLEHAMKYFRLSLPETGRQTFHSELPVGEMADEDDARRFALRYAECFPDEARLLYDAETIGADTPFDYYKPVQDLVDDRGVVWIRQGPPDHAASSVGGEPAEVWVYDRPGGPLVLQFRGADFQGSSGASTLVPSLLSEPAEVRNQVCAVYQPLCPASTRNEPVRLGAAPAYVPKTRCDVDSANPFTGRAAALAAAADALNSETRLEGMRQGSAEVVLARDKGREAIDTATRTDAYPRAFTHVVRPAVEIYALDSAGGVSPRLVVGYAVPGNQLSGSKLSATGQSVYEVDIRLMAVRRSDGQRFDLDSPHQFLADSALHGGQYLTGTLELPVPSGDYTASLVVEQRDGRGAVATLDAVQVPAGSARLAVSDIVLGRPGSPVVWHSGSAVVPLNPLNTFPVGGNADVYVQLSGARPGVTYQMRFGVYDADAGPGKPARLTIAVSQAADRSWIEVARTLGLRNLPAGHYRVQLDVSGAGATATASALLTIEKQ